MATTKNTYTQSGSTTNYSFTFPYIKQTDVKVSLDNVVKSLTSDYTFANATTVSFNTAPTAGAAIAIYRSTDDSNLVATFYPGSAIRSTDLNDNYTQNLYSTQENTNDATDALDNSRVLESGAYVSAVTKAATAITTANTASTNASAAVTTANTASASATTAVNTANTANTTAGSAVTTANSATTTANSATTTANAATTTANGAVTTANTASTNATAAVNTANTANTTAGTANTTANTASTNASAAVTTANTASTNASAAVVTANNAASDVADAVLYTSVANKAALEALTPSEDGYYQVADSTALANATWGIYTLSGIPGTYPSSALDGITTRLSYTHSSKTFAYVSYTVNDADNRYLAPGDLLDEDNMASNSATKVASQQSIKAYSDLKAPLASPTFTGTVAIPNVANLETAVVANTAKVTNVVTNLSVTANGTSLTVASSDGTDATIPAVTTSAWGAMTDEDKTKLDGIATSATANAGDAVLASDQNWTGAQRGALTTVTAASTTAFDFNLGNNFYIDMATAAITTINASNATAGQSGSIIIKGHGSNTMAGWNAVYKFSGGTAPTITADAAKYDRIDYIIYDASNIHMVWSGNY